jgi:alpha-1,6-mannosyltransferase
MTQREDNAIPTVGGYEGAVARETSSTAELAAASALPATPVLDPTGTGLASAPTTPPPPKTVGTASAPPTPAPARARTGPAKRCLQALGALGLLGVPASVLVIVGGAAAAPSIYVPASRAGFPSWMSGPLHGLHMNFVGTNFQTLALVLVASYLLVLLAVRALPANAVYLSILLAHLVLLIGPVMYSRDLFGYLSYARLGALHGLDPYTHGSSAAPADAVYPYLGWHNVSSPYGPLFTLLTYAVVPLGLAGGVWALKTLAVLCSLGAVALVARAADGRASAAAAFLGLNPILLTLTLGGGHNDTLLVLLLAAALALSAATVPRNGRAIWALVAAAGVKLSAGLTLPFLILAPRRIRERARLAASGLAALAALAAIGRLGFSSHALGFLSALEGEQQRVSGHSVPAELARLAGVTGPPGWWRDGFVALFALVFLYALWRTARGTDWRLAAGWTTLALLVCTAWLLPWYAIWPLPFAAVTEDRRLRVAALAFCAYALLLRLPFALPLLNP